MGRGLGLASVPANGSKGPRPGLEFVEDRTRSGLRATSPRIGPAGEKLRVRSVGLTTVGSPHSGWRR